jgi:hypothetical protein
LIAAPYRSRTSRKTQFYTDQQPSLCEAPADVALVQSSWLSWRVGPAGSGGKQIILEYVLIAAKARARE